MGGGLTLHTLYNDVVKNFKKSKYCINQYNNIV